MAVAAVLLALLSYAAFGLHVPDLSTQSKLVTSESVPNLLGLALGLGLALYPLASLLDSGLDILISGVAAGTIAFVVHKWREGP